LAGKFQPRARGVARADDRDHRPISRSGAPRTPSRGGASSSVASRGG
jgi:hypothetical protein